MSERCACCGQIIRKLNPHRMDAAKVHLLQQIAILNMQGWVWVKVQRDGNLIKPNELKFTIQCDDVHALRLTWFGLLESAGRRSGLYKATDKGFKFLCGKVKVPKVIFCKDGEVRDFDAEMVSITQIRKVKLDKEYWDNYAKRQIPDTSVRTQQPQLI